MMYTSGVLACLPDCELIVCLRVKIEGQPDQGLHV